MEATNLSSIPETVAVGQVGDRHARENQPEQGKKKKKKERKTSYLLNPNDEVILSNDADVSINSPATNSNEESKSSDGPEHHIDIAA